MGSKNQGTKLGRWMARPGGRAVMGYLFGIGASVVIIGALFKIMHWPGCDIMLQVGLGTEAFLFFLSSFGITHAEPDWSIYYPYAYPEEERHKYSLKGSTDSIAVDSPENQLAISGGGSGSGAGKGTADSVTDMMEKAKIDQALLERLGNAMRDLSNNAEQLKSVSSAASATDSYVASLEVAAKNISQLSDSYAAASKNVAGITVDGTGVQDFGSQISTAANNLKELNASLAGVGSLQTVMSSLSESAEDTKAYASNMKVLAKNLEDLNSVYGNMLRAMGK